MLTAAAFMSVESSRAVARSPHPLKQSSLPAVQRKSTLLLAWVQVRRGDHLLDDTLIQIQNAGARRQLKFPLRVKFSNEDAVDEGGVQKVQNCVRRSL